jgi:hypothetical protein
LSESGGGQHKTEPRLPAIERGRLGIARRWVFGSGREVPHVATEADVDGTRDRKWVSALTRDLMRQDVWMQNHITTPVP